MISMRSRAGSEVVHLLATWFWLGNLPLLAFKGVRDSVPYIAFCSVYANFASHWSAYQGSRAERAATGGGE